MSLLSLIGRNDDLFLNDISSLEREIGAKVRNSRFLVIGAAGSIGQAVTREIFKKLKLQEHELDKDYKMNHLKFLVMADYMLWCKLSLKLSKCLALPNK